MEFDRYLLQILIEHLVPNKVNLIFGTRRVGKTYLLNQLLARNGYRTLVLAGEDIDTQQLLAPRNIANYRRLLEGIDLLIIELENGLLRAYEFKWSVNPATLARVKAPKAFADNYPDASFEVIDRNNYLDFLG